jgi:hypothetical protein
MCDVCANMDLLVLHFLLHYPGTQPGQLMSAVGIYYLSIPGYWVVKKIVDSRRVATESTIYISYLHSPFLLICQSLLTPDRAPHEKSPLVTAFDFCSFLFAAQSSGMHTRDCTWLTDIGQALPPPRGCCSMYGISLVRVFDPLTPRL